MDPTALHDDEDGEDQHDRDRNHRQRELHARRKRDTEEHHDRDQCEEQDVPDDLGKGCAIELTLDRVVDGATDHRQNARTQRQDPRVVQPPSGGAHSPTEPVGHVVVE